MIFVGDDWAEDHHDVYVMDADGARLASRRRLSTSLLTSCAQVTYTWASD